MLDKLDQIYNMQKKLHSRIVTKNNRFPKLWIKRLFMIAYAIQNECTEVQNLTNWRWWKKPTGVNNSELKEEWIDIFHFWLDGAIEIGLTPSDIYDEYIKKNKINHKRQDEGY